MKATVRLEHQFLAVETEHEVHAMLQLVAPPAPAEKPRQPLNLALVIDRSGSMAGPKLEVTKECAAFLVRRLEPTDRLSLVTFDDEVGLVAPLMSPREPGLQHVLAGILPGGSTNLSGGWLKGVEVLQGAKGDGPRRVLLLTDGQANVGVTDRESLAAMSQNASGAGVGTTTVGFGEDFDEELITDMAEAGGGHSYFAATPDDAPGIFAQEFEGLISLVAQNVSVEVRPSEAVQVVGVLNEFPQVGVEGGVQVQLGDAFAEEERRVVFALRIPDLARLGVEKVADMVIRYVSVGEEVAMHELTAPVTVNLVSADEAAAAGADAEVSEEVLILKAARAEREAMKLADEGNFDNAKDVLRQAAKELRTRAPESTKAKELLEQAEEDLSTVHQRLDDADAARRHLLENVASGGDEARRRFATALHDDVLQQLTAAELQLERISIDASKTRYAAQLGDLKRTMRNIEESLRNVLYNISPTAPHVHVNLTDAIRDRLLASGVDLMDGDPLRWEWRAEL
jgi:Ca-activated chloride channel family protein